jgi:hypothetical protein
LKVEGEDAADPVHRHRRDEARVVNLVADHAMRHHQALLYGMDRRLVGQQRKDPFDVFERHRHHRDAEAEAILRLRSGRRRSELSDMLRRHMHRLAAEN